MNNIWFSLTPWQADVVMAVGVVVLYGGALALAVHYWLWSRRGKS